MIITKEFVMLNLPKTGSTFVRTVLKQLYRPKGFKRALLKLKLIAPPLIELKLPNIKMENRRADQHGTFSQIPPEFLNREVFSVIRDPYSRFLSLYQFRSWANPEQLTVDPAILDRDFPEFPDLDIDAFVDLLIESEKSRLRFFTGVETNSTSIGVQTIQFIQMFFKDPVNVLNRLDDSYFESGAYRKDLAVTRFIRQEDLNEELFQYLRKYEFKEQDLEFIRSYKKLNVTKANKGDRSDLWTAKALNYIQYRERHLLQMLKDLDIHYTSPV